MCVFVKIPCAFFFHVKLIFSEFVTQKMHNYLLQHLCSWPQFERKGQPHYLLYKNECIFIMPQFIFSCALVVHDKITSGSRRSIAPQRGHVHLIQKIMRTSRITTHFACSIVAGEWSRSNLPEKQPLLLKFKCNKDSLYWNKACIKRNSNKM